MTRLGIFAELLANSAQLETSNGHLIVYQDLGTEGRYVPFATFDQELADKYSPISGSVAGWQNPGFQNGTYDPSEGWFCWFTPEGSIIIGGKT